MFVQISEQWQEIFQPDDHVIRWKFSEALATSEAASAAQQHHFNGCHEWQTQMQKVIRAEIVFLLRNNNNNNSNKQQYIHIFNNNTNSYNNFPNRQQRVFRLHLTICASSKYTHACTHYCTAPTTTTTERTNTQIPTHTHTPHKYNIHYSFQHYRNRQYLYKKKIGKTMGESWENAPLKD